jgi:hypothetical protein
MSTPTPKVPRVVVRQDYCDCRCLTQLSVLSSCIFNTSRDDLSMDTTYERQVDSCDNSSQAGLLRIRAISPDASPPGILRASMMFRPSRITSQVVCRADLARISRVTVSALDAAMLSMVTSKSAHPFHFIATEKLGCLLPCSLLGNSRYHCSLRLRQRLRSLKRDSPVAESTSWRRRLPLLFSPMISKSSLESERKQVKSPDPEVLKCCLTINIVECEVM